MTTSTSWSRDNVEVILGTPGDNGVPVGSVMEYIGPDAPVGWLLCDGATIDAADYPALAALLGGTTLPDFHDPARGSHHIVKAG